MILVPVDFSDHSKLAIDYAVKFAVQTSNKLVLLNTYHLKYTDTGFFVDFDDSVIEISKELLEKLKQETLAKHHELNESDIDVYSRLGDLSSVVCQIEDEEKVDLVVIGTKGRSGFEEILLGSQAASVIANSKSSILVIPDEAKSASFKKIACAFELKEDLGVKDKELINGLAPDGVSSVHVFHNYDDVLDVDIEEEHLMFDRFKEKFSTDQVYLDLNIKSDTEQSIEDYLDEIQPDLIVVRSKHRSLLSSLFHVSVAKKLCYHTTIPMLVLR